MGFPIPGKDSLYTEKGPWCLTGVYLLFPLKYSTAPIVAHCNEIQCTYGGPLQWHPIMANDIAYKTANGWSQARVSRINTTELTNVGISEKFDHFTMAVHWTLVSKVLLNLRALKITTFHNNQIYQSMDKIFCVEFQRYSLKFYAKFLTRKLKDMIFMHYWKFENSYAFALNPNPNTPGLVLFFCKIWRNLTVM